MKGFFVLGPQLANKSPWVLGSVVECCLSAPNGSPPPLPVLTAEGPEEAAALGEEEGRQAPGEAAGDPDQHQDQDG